MYDIYDIYEGYEIFKVRNGSEASCYTAARGPLQRSQISADGDVKSSSASFSHSADRISTAVSIYRAGAHAGQVEQQARDCADEETCVFFFSFLITNRALK